MPGWVEPADMREIKRLASAMGVDTIMFPDTSDVLDAPQTGKHEFYPKGGATVEQLRPTGRQPGHHRPGPERLGGRGRGSWRPSARCPRVLELPIGLRATDRFIERAAALARVKVPESITDERGRLVDMITDMHQYFYGKRVALWGDPDQLVSLAEFLSISTCGRCTWSPARPASTSRGASKRSWAAACPRPRSPGRAGRHVPMHQWIKKEPVDLLIGNTYGKYIARDEDIPFVRHGFPIWTAWATRTSPRWATGAPCG